MKTRFIPLTTLTELKQNTYYTALCLVRARKNNIFKSFKKSLLTVSFLFNSKAFPSSKWRRFRPRQGLLRHFR